jgi:two-component system sensor histidine kinase RpfC
MSDTYASAAAKSRLSSILSKAIPAWKNRPDSEHEQAAIRLVVGSIASAYLVFNVVAQHRSLQHTGYFTTIGIATFFIAAIAIAIWLVIRPEVNVPRRICGCIVDNYGATASLFVHGDLAAPIFVVYLWVTFGNGFRYGRRYLLFSMMLSIVGFSLVLFTANEWTRGVEVNIGLLIGLIALPLYVASLLKRLESALDESEVANRAKSNFLATMSHEIRTPLNGLIGLLDLLDMTTLKSKQQHYVDLMKKSSEWLLNIISDGLDFTKIEAGELIVEPTAMNIGETIDNITQVFNEIARTKGITIKAEVARTLPNRVLCDKNRLTQVLNNLLNNACKFTDKGQVKLSVKTKKLAGEKVRVIFVIEDSGIGIADDQLEEIFLPFKQIEFANHRDFGGTGLGLAIVSRLVKLMGGEIRVDSQLGVGTTFTFYLDLAVVEDDEIIMKDKPEKGIYWRRRPVILLAEDNSINQEVATTYLNHLGCEVVTVSDGYGAVEKVRDHRFDLILMDCQMPRMDGYEATRRIRALESETKRTTIVALTAHITNQDRQKCFEVGMDDYMGKPYRISNLKDLLYRWLQPMVILQDSHAPQKASIPDNESIQPDHDALINLHDFRNAMSGAIGGVELALLSIDDTKECERLLKDALEASQKAVSLASKLK